MVLKNGSGATQNGVHHQYNHHHQQPPQVGEGECSVLGMAVFGAHHHNQVINLVCQIWCPFELPQRSPHGSDTAESTGHSLSEEEERDGEGRAKGANGHGRSRRRSSSFSGTQGSSSGLGTSYGGPRRRGLSGGSGRELESEEAEETRAELEQCHQLLEEFAGEPETLEAIYCDLKARHDRRVSQGNLTSSHQQVDSKSLHRTLGSSKTAQSSSS